MKQNIEVRKQLVLKRKQDRDERAIHSVKIQMEQLVEEDRRAEASIMEDKERIEESMMYAETYRELQDQHEEEEARKNKAELQKVQSKICRENQKLVTAKVQKKDQDAQYTNSSIRSMQSVGSLCVGIYQDWEKFKLLKINIR